MEEITDQTERQTMKLSNWLIWLLVFKVILISLAGIILVATFKPASFVEVVEFEVETGDNAYIISQNAKEAGLVKSETIFYIALSYLHDTSNIFAGKYIVEPGNVFAVAKTIASNEIVDESYRLTIPEGIPVKAIAEIIGEIDNDISAEEFLALASSSEGLLYPETYLIPINYTALDIFSLLERTHQEKFAEIKEAGVTDLSDYEVVILASIIEREANDEESMRMVSGILQNRIEIGMPLQADASIEYVLEKPLSELTPDDLKIDSPYNTYLNRDLPPTPIGNPGEVALSAVLNPADTEALFYITGNDGVFYYANTYDQHLSNIENYLR